MKRGWLLLVVVLGLSLQTLYGRKVKVACVGNSVTYGYLLKDREHDAYPAQLNRLLGEDYEVRNFGKSGATLLNRGHRPYTQQPEFQDAVAFAADRVVIHLGLNDTDPRDWANFRDDFTADYLRLIDTFRQVNPHCKIWICRMSPITVKHARFKAGTRDWYWQIQEAIEHVASVAGTGLIDLQEGLYDRPDLLPDALHPTAEGAGIIARAVYVALTGDYGGLQLSAVYSDHMVLQRNKPLKIEGRANAGVEVKVKLGKQEKYTVAASDGKWEVLLSPMEAGGPYRFEVEAGREKRIFKDVWMGEVWLCSGQSNMAFMVKETGRAKEVPKSASQAVIRLYNMKPRVFTDAVSWDSLTLVRLNRLDYYQSAEWQEATAENVAEFSAVAWYFGKMLADSLNVPVGLICNAVGGAPAEAFIDRKTMEFDPRLVDVLQGWRQSHFLQPWVRERAALNLKNATVPAQRHPYEPCYLYKTGIEPIAGYSLRGVIWYQGESNAHNMEWHEVVFPALVDSWRRTWHEPLPFYYVQLSGINRPSWPEFRNSQRRLMAVIPNSGMAVSSDWGHPTNVHPVNKQPIGERLARWALHCTYGYKHVVPSGPLYKDVEFAGDVAYVRFDYGQGLHAADGEELRSFEVAGEDRIFVPAEAVVEGEKVKVWSSCVKRPQYVRYGWQPYTTANLMNGDGLPASTFRSEKGK